MKKILLTSSVAVLLLQGAVTANAAFSLADLDGTYGYSLSGQTGELSVAIQTLAVSNGTDPDPDLLAAAGVNASIPNYMSEVGVFKADGLGGISQFHGTTHVRENIANNAKLNPYNTTYDCPEPYFIDNTGQGKVSCVRTDKDIFNIDTISVQDVLINFVIDDHNKEVRLSEIEFSLTNPPVSCDAKAPVVTIAQTSDAGSVTDAAQGNPLCNVQADGSARQQHPHHS